MGEAKQKKNREEEARCLAEKRRAFRKLAIKRLPKALFWATAYPIWMWVLFFVLVIKTGKSPLKEALDQ